MGFFYRIADGYPRARAAFALISIVGGAVILVLDGSGVGLKYGVGGGVYVLWGQAAMLRIEAAYSPDAVSENPSLPLGIYVEDGTMF